MIHDRPVHEDEGPGCPVPERSQASAIPPVSGLVRAGLWITALTVLSKILGLAREGVLAWAFGTSAVVDAFRISQTGIFLLIHLLAGSPMDSAFLPTFKHLLSSGRKRLAWRTVFLTSRALLVAGSLVALALLAFAEPCARLLAPGFDPERTRLTARLLRAMALAVPLGLLTNLFIGVATGLYRFRVAALRAPIQNGTVLIGIVASVAFGSVLFLGFSLPVSQALVLALLLLSLRGVFRPSWRGAGERDRAAWRFLGVALVPALGLVFLEQANVVVERVVASRLPEGSVASLDYARFLVETPIVTLGLGITQVLLPTLSDLSAARQEERVLRSMRSLLRTCLWALLPVSAWLCLSGEDLVRIIYARGAFGDDSVRTTTAALLGFAIGLWAWFSGTVVLQKLLYAQRRLRALLPLTGFVLVAFGLLAFALAPRFGVFGVSLAFSLSQLVFFAGGVMLQGRDLWRSVVPALAWLLPGAVAIALLPRGLLPDWPALPRALAGLGWTAGAWCLWTLPIRPFRETAAGLMGRVWKAR